VPVLNCTHLSNAHDSAVSGVSYMRLGLRDSSSDAPLLHAAFARGVEFIASALEEGGTVLVHCRAGISRSPTLAAAYLVRATRTPVDKVFSQMRRTRHVVDPNLTYSMALHEWEPHGLSNNGVAACPRTPLLCAAPSPPSHVRLLSVVG
jgi:protein-tyrosine phosphatase